VPGSGAADHNPVDQRRPRRRARRRTRRRRDRAHRRRQRADERVTRRHAAQTAARLVAGGRSWYDVSRLFNVAPRTLRRWCRAPASAAPLGRPVRRSDRAAREAVIRFLDEHGPHVGVPALRACFPALGRAELTDLLRRYRAVWRARNRVPLRVLRWSGAGRVWAIDFTGPIPAIEGAARYVLAVRDLASGRQLLWRAVATATGEAAREALADLFARHGAPLVLKSDNGSPFTCGEVRALLAEHEVVALYSPPYWPRYNGAIEAGIGALKDRTACRAARAGHAGVWTWDDLADARAEANATARPWCESSVSPDEVWSARAPITADERAAFGAAVAVARPARAREVGTCADEEVGVTSEASVARSAIELALTQRGYLQYRRRSIPPPINRQ
jgi:putative transposase